MICCGINCFVLEFHIYTVLNDYANLKFCVSCLLWIFVGLLIVRVWIYLGFCEVGGGKVINSVHGPLAMDSGKKREFGTSASEPHFIQPASGTGKRDVVL